MVSSAREIFEELCDPADGHPSRRTVSLSDIERIIMRERERCVSIARGWAADVMQYPDARLVAAYIEREINDPR